MYILRNATRRSWASADALQERLYEHTATGVLKVTARSQKERDDTVSTARALETHGRIGRRAARGVDEGLENLALPC